MANAVPSGAPTRDPIRDRENPRNGRGIGEPPVSGIPRSARGEGTLAPGDSGGFGRPMGIQRPHEGAHPRPVGRFRNAQSPTRWSNSPSFTPSSIAWISAGV